MIEKLIRKLGFEEALECLATSEFPFGMDNCDVDNDLITLEEEKIITFDQTLAFYKKYATHELCIHRSLKEQAIIFNHIDQSEDLFYVIARRILHEGKSDLAEQYDILNFFPLLIGGEMNLNKSNFMKAFPEVTVLAKQWYVACKSLTGIIVKYQDTFTSDELYELYPTDRDVVMNNVCNTHLSQNFIEKVMSRLDYEIITKVLQHEPRLLTPPETPNKIDFTELLLNFSEEYSQSLPFRKRRKRDITIPYDTKLVNLIFTNRHTYYGDRLFTKLENNHIWLLTDEHLAEYCELLTIIPDTKDQMKRLIQVIEYIPNFKHPWKITWAYEVAYEHNIRIFSFETATHENYRVVPVMLKSEGLCEICFNATDSKLSTCNHHFHAECYTQWNGPCPMCHERVWFYVELNPQSQ
jgi:hypothetical protein